MAIRTLPSIDYLRQVLEYDAESGDLFWKPRPTASITWNLRFAGKKAGSIHCKGYISIAIDGRAYLAHRVIWALHYGEHPAAQIDHKDLNPKNNKISNLRQATPAQNRWNERARSNNQLGIKGVHYNEREKRFIAELKVNYRRVHHSSHKSLQEAIDAHQEAATKYHGEFARTK